MTKTNNGTNPGVARVSPQPTPTPAKRNLNFFVVSSCGGPRERLHLDEQPRQSKKAHLTLLVGRELLGEASKALHKSHRLRLVEHRHGRGPVEEDFEVCVLLRRGELWVEDEHAGQLGR